MRIRAIVFFLCLASGAVFLLVTQVDAQVRTTPVEVKNSPLVRIDPLGGDVKAFQGGDWYVSLWGNPGVSQSGTWNVGVTNTPNVSVTNSPTVKIDGTTNTVKAAQSGAWNVGVSGNVGISGTPNVNVANTPSVSVSNIPNVSVTNTPYVKIDPSTNTVRTPANFSTIQLWSTDQLVANGGQLYSSAFECTGFRTMRLMSTANATGAALTLRVEFLTPVPGTFIVAVNQSFPGSSIALEVPIYSQYARVVIFNNLGFPTTISRASFVYLLD